MQRATFGWLTVLAFGLILGSFVVMGLSRIVLAYRTARILAAPLLLLGAILVVSLFVQSLLVLAGLREIEE